MQLEALVDGRNKLDDDVVKVSIFYLDSTYRT
ncbi:hypothetical protein AOLE_09755 [Acinetobacter oleivorans DR1]|uniref:Uncharacterized protein n=1 Tax=Acinetobacter oleivorans (strain JCM 16667 / KCTC 23045 / DR1) TaxID=436717 RepID=A0AAN0UD77_ACISD|nr:hypothetical protein AOLE_09755 [Acinetobacter oleivorans DR1]